MCCVVMWGGGGGGDTMTDITTSYSKVNNNRFLTRISTGQIGRLEGWGGGGGGRGEGGSNGIERYPDR